MDTLSPPHWQKGIAITGILLLGLFLGVHLHKDLSAELQAWYFHSTTVWLIGDGFGFPYLLATYQKNETSWEDIQQKFMHLPDE